MCIGGVSVRSRRFIKPVAVFVAVQQHANNPTTYSSTVRSDKLAGMAPVKLQDARLSTLNDVRELMPVGTAPLMLFILTSRWVRPRIALREAGSVPVNTLPDSDNNLHTRKGKQAHRLVCKAGEAGF